MCLPKDYHRKNPVYQEVTFGVVILIILNQGREIKGPSIIYQFLCVSLLGLGLGLRLPDYQRAKKFLYQLRLVLGLGLLLPNIQRVRTVK